MGLIGQELNGSYSSYHFDIRGSTTAITDKNASVTDRFDYGQYGELVNHTGNTSTPFLYNGRDGVMTDNNGLYYMRARYYNPDTKRFINQDILTGSISDGRTLNRYAYVNVNPISLTDPFGLSPNINPLSILPGLLDLVSMIDPFEITDLISAGIYALEGDYTMAKTLISTKAGLKQIKDIKAGDEVYSANPETGEKGLKKVKEVYINETDTLVHVFAGDEEIRTTETHPFWVEGKGWIDAGSL